MKVDVLTIDSKKTGTVELADSIFGLESRPDILHRVVEWQRAKKRSGTHKTKGISEVSGTGKKPHAQKGTGKARQGSLRSSQFRGGAIIFGPLVRDHGYDLPKKVRKLGLKTALSSKLSDGNLIVFEDFKLETAKTNELSKKLKQMNLDSVLFVDGNEVDSNLKAAASNLMHVDVLPTMGANVYDILNHDKLIISKAGLEALTERLK